jgi:hypothetical protein
VAAGLPASALFTSSRHCTWCTAPIGSLHSGVCNSGMSQKHAGGRWQRMQLPGSLALRVGAASRLRPSVTGPSCAGGDNSAARRCARHGAWTPAMPAGPSRPCSSYSVRRALRRRHHAAPRRCQALRHAAWRAPRACGRPRRLNAGAYFAARSLPALRRVRCARTARPLTVRAARRRPPPACTSARGRAPRSTLLETPARGCDGWDWSALSAALTGLRRLGG